MQSAQALVHAEAAGTLEVQWPAAQHDYHLVEGKKAVAGAASVPRGLHLDLEAAGAVEVPAESAAHHLYHLLEQSGAVIPTVQEAASVKSDAQRGIESSLRGGSASS